MKQLVNNLKGDKVIWSFVALLALFYACFSASSNLAYLGHGTGNTLGYLVKHLCISVSYFSDYLWCT
jgi:cell division protein FtsW